MAQMHTLHPHVPTLEHVRHVEVRDTLLGMGIEKHVYVEEQVNQCHSLINPYMMMGNFHSFNVFANKKMILII